VIPDNISREDVLRALEKLARSGAPRRRQSTRYLLAHGDRGYPPRYVLAVANTFANGWELHPTALGGGGEANAYLKKLGFTIVTMERGLQIKYH